MKDYLKYIFLIAAIIFAVYFLIKKIAGIIGAPVKWVKESRDEVEEKIEETTGKIIPLNKQADEKLKTEVKSNLRKASYLSGPASPFFFLNEIFLDKIGKLIK